MRDGGVEPAAANGDGSDLSAFGFHDERWFEELREAVAPPQLGTIGRYEIVEEVSRGGQGIVYRARDPRTSRHVALKRLVAGTLASSSTRFRFEREVEAAAALDHPNIVTLYGSELVDGQPVLVMQWIDGVPITASAAAGRRKRLESFIKACDAVHHAHRRGVIHRDLKPSNILVDASGEPHVLDFGMAKLAADGAGGVTVSGQFLGTPAYASPEHIRGRAADVDIRADVYALGVVLYELLCGRMPYPVEGSLAEIFETIERAEPVRPSRARPGLDAELDAIVLKALEKDPDRRYQSVEALGRDLARHLAGEPVAARSASALYRARKTIRRHRVPVAAGLVFVLLVLGYIVTMPVLYVRAERQADRALKVQQFLSETLTSTSPYRLGSDLKVTTMLALAAGRADRELAGEPEAEAAIRHTIARAYANLWLWPEAEPHSRRAAELYRTLDGADSRARYAACLNLLGRSLGFQKDPASVDVLEETLAVRRRLHAGDHAETAEALCSLGFAFWHACRPPRLADAEACYGASLAMYERLGGGPTPDRARAVYSNAMFRLNTRRYAEAEAGFLEALDMYRRLEGETFYLVRCLDGYGRLLRETDRHQEAEAVLLEAVALHPAGVATRNLAAMQWCLGNVARCRGRVALARRRYRASLATTCDRLASELSAPELRDEGARLRGDGAVPHAEIVALLEAIAPGEACRWRDAAGEIEALDDTLN